MTPATYIALWACAWIITVPPVVWVLWNISELLSDILVELRRP